MEKAVSPDDELKKSPAQGGVGEGGGKKVGFHHSIRKGYNSSKRVGQEQQSGAPIRERQEEVEGPAVSEEVKERDKKKEEMEREEGDNIDKEKEDDREEELKSGTKEENEGNDGHVNEVNEIEDEEDSGLDETYEDDFEE